MSVGEAPVSGQTGRRALLRAGVIGALAMAVPALRGVPAGAQPAGFAAPGDLLVFALQLKYFQAEFYRQGNEQGLLEGLAGDWLAQIARHKQAQVAALTDAINRSGGRPPVAPALQFGEDTFVNRQGYLERAVLVEETVVRSYIALPTSADFPDADVYTELAGIFSVDARAAAVLAVLGGLPTVDGVYRGGFERGIEAPQALELLRPYVAGPWDIADDAGITA